MTELYFLKEENKLGEKINFKALQWKTHKESCAQKTFHTVKKKNA